MESVGFKEWAFVCDALGRGEQSVILRKGGIAEGPSGFAFQHREFFLFPTFFHEQIEKIRTTAALPQQIESRVEIRFFVKVERAIVIGSWEDVKALEPLHILREGVVRERFDYETPGLHVAFVRVWRLEPAWILDNKPEYGGCRSWVKLPERPATIDFALVQANLVHH